MTRSFLIFMCIVSSLSSAFANTELKTGRVYAIGDMSNILFTQKIEVNRTSPDDFTLKSSVVDSDGKEISRDIVKVENSVVVDQLSEQYQVNEAYEIKLKDKKLIFSTYKIKDGKKIIQSSSEQDLPENFITGPTIGHFVKKNKEKLEKGETIYAEFGSIELEKTVGFKFKMLSKDHDSIRIQIKLSNLIFQMMVDPMILDIDLKSGEFLRFEGRTPFRHGPGKQSIDAVIQYNQFVLQKK